MLSALLVVSTLLPHAVSAEARKGLDEATAEFKRECGATGVSVQLDLAALGKRYDRTSWLRDDDTAAQRCGELLTSLAGTCRLTRLVVWSGLDKRAVQNDTTVDLSPLAKLKTVTCTAPSFVGALDALVAQHPEWPSGDRWTNAGKLHWDEDYRLARLAPEFSFVDGAITMGIFEGTMNPGEVQRSLEHRLIDLEYEKVLAGGPIGTTGRFAVLKKWMDGELKRFNTSCGASATVEVDWKGLEQAWPGWTIWHDKSRDFVMEDVAVQGFVDRVLGNLADLCARDEDEKFASLKKVKTFKVTGDPRGVKVMAAKRAKPKKSFETLAKELFPDTPYLQPSFSWKGDTFTYGLWVEVVNPESASEWLQSQGAPR